MRSAFFLSLAILLLAILAMRWSLDRGILAGPQARWSRRFAVIFVALYILCIIPFSVPHLRPPAAPPLPPAGQISQHQVYISKIEGLNFEAGVAGEFIDFGSGTLLETGAGRSGYVFLGLPGRAELFLGPDTRVRLLSADSTGVELQLEQGRIILNLRDDFPAGRRVTVLSAGGATTWLDGSKMCLTYEPASKALRMDCVEDRCGYTDGGERAILAGYHVTFTGAKVVEAGVGLQPEACQFVPGVVPHSTLTPTLVPADPTPDGTSQP